MTRYEKKFRTAVMTRLNRQGAFMTPTLRNTADINLYMKMETEGLITFKFDFKTGGYLVSFNYPGNDREG